MSGVLSPPLRLLTPETHAISDAMPPQLTPRRRAGYQFCDIPHNGVHVVVTTNGDAALAKEVGEEMGQWIWDQRGEL